VTGTGQRVADLERQVAELTETVRKLAVMAATIQTLAEMRVQRLDPWPPAARPRRLHVVNGGAS
jgi:hypothetical protein